MRELPVGPAPGHTGLPPRRVAGLYPLRSVGMTDVMAPYVPQLPADYIESLTDGGRWRQRGITHWHLVCEEQPITIGGRPNGARFDTDRIRGLVARSSNSVAFRPVDALRWLARQYVTAMAQSSDPARIARQRGYGSERDWLFALECMWETLSGGSLITPAGGGMEVWPNHSLDVHAYPMTIARCRVHAAPPA